MDFSFGRRSSEDAAGGGGEDSGGSSGGGSALRRGGSLRSSFSEGSSRFLGALGGAKNGLIGGLSSGITQVGGLLKKADEPTAPAADSSQQYSPVSSVSSTRSGGGGGGGGFHSPASGSAFSPGSGAGKGSPQQYQKKQQQQHQQQFARSRQSKAPPPKPPAPRRPANGAVRQYSADTTGDPATRTPPFNHRQVSLPASRGDSSFDQPYYSQPDSVIEPPNITDVAPKPGSGVVNGGPGPVQPEPRTPPQVHRSPVHLHQQPVAASDSPDIAAPARPTTQTTVAEVHSDRERYAYQHQPPTDAVTSRDPYSSYRDSTQYSSLDRQSQGSPKQHTYDSHRLSGEQDRYAAQESYVSQYQDQYQSEGQPSGQYPYSTVDQNRYPGQDPRETHRYPYEDSDPSQYTPYRQDINQYKDQTTDQYQYKGQLEDQNQPKGQTTTADSYQPTGQTRDQYQYKDQSTDQYQYRDQTTGQYQYRDQTADQYQYQSQQPQVLSYQSQEVPDQHGYKDTSQARRLSQEKYPEYREQTEGTYPYQDQGSTVQYTPTDKSQYQYSSHQSDQYSYKGKDEASPQHKKQDRYQTPKQDGSPFRSKHKEPYYSKKVDEPYPYQVKEDSYPQQQNEQYYIKREEAVHRSHPKDTERYPYQATDEYPHAKTEDESYIYRQKEQHAYQVKKEDYPYEQSYSPKKDDLYKQSYPQKKDDPYQQAQQQKDPYQQVQRQKDPYQQVQQQKDPYQQAQQQKDPYQQPQQQKDSYQQAQQQKDPYHQVQQQKDPYQQAQQQKDPYSAAQRQKDPYQQAQQQKDPYQQAQQQKDPYSAAQQQKDPYSAAQQQKDPYSAVQDKERYPYGDSGKAAEPYQYQSQKKDTYIYQQASRGESQAQVQYPPQGSEQYMPETREQDAYGYKKSDPQGRFEYHDITKQDPYAQARQQKQVPTTAAVTAPDPANATKRKIIPAPKLNYQDSGMEYSSNYPNMAMGEQKAALGSGDLLPGIPRVPSINNPPAGSVGGLLGAPQQRDLLAITPTSGEALPMPNIEPSHGEVASDAESSATEGCDELENDDFAVDEKGYGGYIFRSGSVGSDKSWSSSYSDEALMDDMSTECMHFMKDFVHKIFHGGSMSPMDKAKFGQLCQQGPGRLWFSRYVNAQRVDNKKVEEQAFYQLVQYFAICLFECSEDEDYGPAKTLMNMCFTFYYEEPRPKTNIFKQALLHFLPWRDSLSSVSQGKGPAFKHFLYSYLKDQSIWQSLRFWNAAFFDAVQNERRRKPVCTRGDGAAARSDDRQYQENITFGQLGTFTCNMRAFGLNKELCLEFLRKQSTIANLREEQVNMLRENVERWTD